MKQVVAGIDIGGTTTTVGLVDATGHIHAKQTYHSGQITTLPDYLAQLRRVVTTLAHQHGAEIEAVGVGAPAANHRTGTIRASNLKWAYGIPFADALAEDYHLPIALDNDANATAIGEMHFGAAQSYRDFILVTLGTGLGSGIVSNGEVIYGHDGLAGELGHICVDRNGRDCGCGRKGCLETYVSANGLKRTVFELLAHRTTPSPLRDVSYSALSARQVSKAAKAGDPIALEAFEQVGELLGLKLADAVAHTSPQAIILFGGLANAGKLLFEPTIRSLRKHQLFLYNPDLPILPSALPQADAAVLGAAAIAWQKLRKSDHVLL
ncbi:ROK family protein [Rudanella lutea]|uniref:ROK family protein n=1 Tax=Rudanella lutea TaxID=451374 RepID=UPI00037F40F7|nr:ROK family protein [Rudanella lutea]